MSVINSRRFGRFWPVSWTITLFLGPGVISMIDEHRGAFMCRSSTLAVLADSGPFLRVLLSFGGPGLISTIYEPRGAFTCRSMTLTILANFWSVFLYYYSPFWRPRAVSIIYNPWVRLRFCRQHSQFWPILTRFVDYYSSFRGPEATP